MHAWQSVEHPFSLVERSWQKNDPDPKALACYGVLWQEGTSTKPVRESMWLRFVTGRPLSAITTQFLEWCGQRLEQEGKHHWLLIWDHASWHVSRAGANLDQRTEPAGQAVGQRRAHLALAFAQTKPVAQPHRTQMGAWQACRR